MLEKATCTLCGFHEIERETDAVYCKNILSTVCLKSELSSSGRAWKYFQ